MVLVAIGAVVYRSELRRSGSASRRSPIRRPRQIETITNEHRARHRHRRRRDPAITATTAQSFTGECEGDSLIAWAPWLSLVSTRPTSSQPGDAAL